MSHSPLALGLGHLMWNHIIRSRGLMQQLIRYDFQPGQNPMFLKMIWNVCRLSSITALKSKECNDLQDPAFKLSYGVSDDGLKIPGAYLPFCKQCMCAKFK